MQMCCSPYKSSLTCAKTIFATEGLGAFYRSYGTMLTMNIPFQATHFMVYEKMQVLTNPDREYNPHAHLVSGAAAGALAATITMPLDVCKTLLNTQVLVTIIYYRISWSTNMYSGGECFDEA